MFGPNPEIYKRLYDQLILTNSDKEKLIEKRGLTESTIKTLGFKSARKENAAIITHLLSEFGYGACYSCGLVNSKHEPSWQFTKEGMVIIPYFNTKSEIIFYKSHKFGNLPEMGVLPYSQWLAAFYWLRDKNNEALIICESEFKAAAMWQMGWPAIGLGGIASFTGLYFSRLSGFFFDLFKAHQLKFKKLIVLFDTEIQDDPDLASYKQDYQRRYAQHIYSYIMAIRLREIQASLFVKPESVETDDKVLNESDLHKINLQDAHDNILIASLPSSWTINGKADIDSAIAAGHSKGEFEIVLKNALRPEAYRYQMEVPLPHLPWVNRQMEKALHDSNIFKHHRSYHVTILDKTQKKSFTKELSNFIIETKNVIIRDNNTFREIQIHSKYGDSSVLFEASSEEMSNTKAFKTKCLSKGDFLWKGTDMEFNMVMEEMFLETSGTNIYILDFIGRDEAHKQWVFGNMIIKDDGRILRPDEDGTFWDLSCGYRVKSLSEFGVLPKLSDVPINIETVLNKFEDAWGIMGRIAFVTALSSLFADAMFRSDHQAFPILMIYGEKESGKSALADALYALFGFGMHVHTKNIIISSVPGITKGVSYYSSLPFRLDEYRNNDPGMDKKDSILRSIYNRQGEIKGTKTSMTRELPMRSTIFLIGEEKPEDPALVSRCVSIYLNKNNNNEKTADALRWLYQNQHELSNVTYQILTQYTKHVKEFIEDVTVTNKSLHTVIRSDFRAQLHFAIMLAMTGRLFPKEKATELIKPLSDYFNVSLKTADQESLLGKFFSDVYTMFVMDEGIHRFIVSSTVDPNIGFIYLNGIYSLWSQYKVRTGSRSSIVTEKNVRDYMRSQPYCVADNERCYIPAKNMRVACIAIDLNHARTPEDLKELFRHSSH